jgi:hypothetical protein
VRFPRVANNWLRFHGRLAVAPAPVHPYERRLQTSVTSSVRPTRSRRRRLTQTGRERS